MSQTLMQCIPNCVPRESLGVPRESLGVPRDFSKMRKKDQFFQTCSKKGHETQFLSKFYMNWQKKIFFGVARNFFGSKSVSRSKKV